MSCQLYPEGYFTAYQHIAEEDLALVVHLGDITFANRQRGYPAQVRYLIKRRRRWRAAPG